MIIETIIQDGQIIRRSSDKGEYLRNTKTGELFEEAFDWYDIWAIRKYAKPVSYEESGIKIPEKPLTAEEALAIITGEVSV